MFHENPLQTADDADDSHEIPSLIFINKDISKCAVCCALRIIMKGKEQNAKT